MTQTPLRPVVEGQELTCTESLVLGGSASRYLIDKSVKPYTPEGDAPIIPETAEQARTPFAILLGNNTVEEVLHARRIGAKSLGFIGLTLSPTEELFMSLSPLTEQGLTVEDPKIGPTVEKHTSSGDILEVQENPAYLDALKEMSPQNFMLRKDGFFPDPEISGEGRMSGEKL